MYSCRRRRRWSAPTGEEKKMKDDDTSAPRNDTSALLVIQDVQVSVIRCHGCGGRTTKLPQDDADKLRKLECLAGLEVLGIAAFECRNCEIVIFEDELIGGERFVPPD